MGFGGSVAAMLSSLKNNKNQLGKKDKYFNKKVDGYSDSYGKLVDHKKMSPYQMEEFKKKLKAERKNEQLTTYIWFVSALVIVVLLIVVILEYIF